jgi:hypothetical protein
VHTPAMLGSYGPWAAGLLDSSSLENPGALSFRDPHWTSAEVWRSAGRGKVRELLAAPGELAAREAPKARVLRAFTVDGVECEELEWQLPYGPRTRALFLKPAGAKGRLPSILGLHDHGGNKYFGVRKITSTDMPSHALVLEHQRLYYGGRAWANEIAPRGVAGLVHEPFPFWAPRVLPSELPGYVVDRMMAPPLGAKELIPEDLHGARGPGAFDVSQRELPEEIAAYNAFAGRHEDIVAKSLFSAGTTWPGVFLSEDQVALDYLASRPDVDPVRMGCCGLSGGGLRTNYLAAMDDRIRCSVTVGFMTTWRDFVSDVSHTHTWMIYIPHLSRSMDYPEILSLHLPRPALVLQTRHDPLFTLGEAEKCDLMLRECWTKAGAADAFRMSFYDGPHKFDVPMQEEAFAWLERWLR